MSDKVRVALVDDDRMLLGLLAAAIVEEGVDVAWTAEGGTEALNILRDGDTPSVDVIAIDVRMPDMDGIELAEQLVGMAPGIPVVMMSSMGDTVAVARAVASGATGFMEKGGPKRLAEVLRAAAAGVRTFPDLPDGWEDLLPGNVYRLTARELDVLRLLSRRLQNREIAQQLVISEYTVKRHVANILKKMGVPDRRSAVWEGDRLGLIRGNGPQET